MRLKRFAILYLAFPIAMSVYRGARGSMFVADLGQAETIALFASFGVPFYLIAAALSYSSLYFLKRVGWPPFIALILGAIAGIVIGYIYTIIYIKLMAGTFPGLETGLSADGRGLAAGLTGFITGQSGITFVLIWIAMHMVYEWGAHDGVFFPRFKNDNPRSDFASSSTATVPIFLSRVPAHLRDNLVALAANEHYVDVFGKDGSSKVLYRFGDAVKELEALKIGVRVHRSYWVATEAIIGIDGSGKSLRLSLSNGMKVPVSHANSGAVKRLVDSGKSTEVHTNS